MISDLHLGGRFFHSVLTREEPLRALLRALDDTDRLVLLGDVVELAERRPTRAMAVAEPVLRAIGARLGAEREVVLIPGNHDFALVRPWVRAIGAELRIDAEVPPDATPALAAVVGWLAPARVRVSYPGTWLGERVWATHGHYLNLHLRPVSSYGRARGNLRDPAPDRVDPAAYERARRRLRRAAGERTGTGSLRQLVTTQIKERILRPQLAPLTSALLRAQMHHASLPAIARVAGRLGVPAEAIIFGHVHRLGPLPGDPERLWLGPGGAPRLFNTGSWLYEPLLVTHAQPPHPHWPGGAIRLEDGGEPEPISLLDHLAPEDLRP